jgi:nucleoside-diphosphate-sugar epimerase
MRVLITGGAGFIGSNLVRGSLEAGDTVRVFDDFSTGVRGNLAGLEPHVEVVEGSVTDPEAVRRAAAGCEVVYHQAALGSVPRSIEEPLVTHAINATGTLNVLDGARHAGVRRLVYAASSSAYGDTETLPKVESMPPRPLSPYALQKQAGEAYCWLYTTLYGLETVALRYFNVYGPRQTARSTYAAVIPRFISALASGERPRVYGDGGQTRDFTFVSDAVAANLAAATAPAEAAGEVYNVADGKRVSLLELLDEIASALEARGALAVSPVEPEFLPSRVGDVRHSLADVSKAERLLGWKPRVSLAEGIAATVEYYCLERAG